MIHSIAEESFPSLASAWVELRQRSRSHPMFVVPVWLRVWWESFGAGARPFLRTVRRGNLILGIVPLLVRGETASFMGSPDVCDYMDFVVAAGEEEGFFDTLLDALRKEGIRHLALESLRPDSTVVTDLAGLARVRGHEVSCNSAEVSFEMSLPATWDGYLDLLGSKQRHEVRRKLRRLSEVGGIRYRAVEDVQGVWESMDTFLKFFRDSREDKAAFMTDRLEGFFRSLAENMAEAGLLRLGMLHIDALPAAAVMCFEYGRCTYLYNSGYDPQFRQFSVGLLCKVLCIKDCIQRGNAKFDFMKGSEAYKHHLGGIESPIHSCQIHLK